MRVISYGGGVQSTALVVLATQGKIGHVDVALFANTGNDSEHPATLRYVREVATPWAAARGLPIIEVTRELWPKGDERTLLSQLQAYNGCQACGATPDDECFPGCPSTVNTGGDLPIPVKLAPSGAPQDRSCTKHWKVVPIDRWLAAHGATQAQPAEALLGISVDEIERATGRASSYSTRAYPLLDLHLTRTECTWIIAEAGLPVPPKSACWFCPFYTDRQLAERHRDDPELYQRLVELEDGLNVQRDRRGLSRVFWSRSLVPLREMSEAQPSLFDGPESCDDGYCWT